MFHNPFEDLGAERISQKDWEEIEGSFSCQERGCYNTVHTAKYLASKKLLTWECENGHIGKVEDFSIE